MTDQPDARADSARFPKLLLAAGAALGVTALVNHANARRAEAEAPPAGEFVVVDGVRLHYTDGGEGSPIVLLHGNGVTLQDFEVSGVTALLAAGHRVIAFDRPGFGYSTRPRSTIWTPRAQARVLLAALDEMGIGPAVIVGHSWGTMVALAMALEQPDAVAGLVLVSGFYYPTARPDVYPMALPAIPLLGDVMAHTLSPLAGVMLGPAIIRESFAPAPVSEKFARFPIGLTVRPSQVHATAADTALMLPGAAGLGRHYATLGMPVAIVAGDGDRITHPDRHARRLAAEIPGATLNVLPGQGHMLHYDEPGAVLAAVDDVAARPATT